MMLREGIYFSPAEFHVMAELSGEGKYTMLSGSVRGLEEEDLRQAFAALTRRGFLIPAGKTLEVTEKGLRFRVLRAAAGTVLVSGRRFSAALYPAGELATAVVLVQGPLADSYRVQLLDREETAGWLQDTGACPEPGMDREDAEDLARVFPDALEEPDGETVFTADVVSRDGNPLCRWTLRRSRGAPVLVRTDGAGSSCQFWTREALAEMLEAWPWEEDVP